MIISLYYYVKHYFTHNITKLGQNHSQDVFLFAQQFKTKRLAGNKSVFLLELLFAYQSATIISFIEVHEVDLSRCPSRSS